MLSQGAQLSLNYIVHTFLLDLLAFWMCSQKVFIFWFLRQLMNFSHSISHTHWYVFCSSKASSVGSNRWNWLTYSERIYLFFFVFLFLYLRSPITYGQFSHLRKKKEEKKVNILVHTYTPYAIRTKSKNRLYRLKVNFYCYV